MKVEINKMVVVWQNCDNHYEWFIGYIKYVDDDNMFTVDHLHRVIYISRIRNGNILNEETYKL